MGSTGVIITLLIFIAVVVGFTLLWKFIQWVRSKIAASCGVEGPHHHHGLCGAPTDCAGAPAVGVAADTPLADVDVEVGGGASYGGGASTGGGSQQPAFDYAYGDYDSYAAPYAAPYAY